MSTVGNNRSCPACHCSQSKSIGEKDSFDMVLCRACRTLYALRLPAHSLSYDQYYNSENLKVPEFIATRLDEIVKTFSPYRNNNRLLDIGCGAGSLLMAAQRDGWDAEGVDVSASAVEHLRLRGLKVFCGYLADAKFPTGHFDVVTASELLEHVPEPSSLIAEVARILRPGGVFWATTPHARGASARVLKLKWNVIGPPEHLHLFSVRGVSSLLWSHGFRRVRVATEGVNPTDLLRTLRRRTTTPSAGVPGEGNKRVEAAHQWNEALLRNPRRRMVKNLANAILRASRMGDSLKIWAER